jgi:1,4-dihydroxy-2-naphthoate octaprenyltransferase
MLSLKNAHQISTNSNDTRERELMTAGTKNPTPFQLFIMAARPKTLWAGLSPVIFGGALAFGESQFKIVPFLTVVFSAIFIQIGTNYANDYFDFKKGADSDRRDGPLRATQSGLIHENAMLWAAICAFALSAIAGLYLVYIGGLPILIIGSLSILFGFLYTAGPFPLAYIGLGDVFVFIFFGLVAVSGTYYVQTGQFSSLSVITGIAPGLYSMAILVANNLRDIATDKKAGKRTLAVRLGASFTRVQYTTAVILGTMVPVPLVALTHRHYWALGSMLSCVLIIPSVKAVSSGVCGAALNRVLASTGMTLFIYSIVFALLWNI